MWSTMKRTMALASTGCRRLAPKIRPWECLTIRGRIPARDLAGCRAGEDLALPIYLASMLAARLMLTARALSAHNQWILCVGPDVWEQGERAAVSPASARAFAGHRPPDVRASTARGKFAAYRVEAAPVQDRQGRSTPRAKRSGSPRSSRACPAAITSRSSSASLLRRSPPGRLATGRRHDGLARRPTQRTTHLFA